MHVEKYELEHGVNQLPLPYAAIVLSVVEKAHSVALYVAVGDGAMDMPTSTRTFVAVETGENIEVGDGVDTSNSTFIGSVRKAGTFTWHVFEVAGVAPLPDALKEAEA